MSQAWHMETDLWEWWQARELLPVLVLLPVWWGWL